MFFGLAALDRSNNLIIGSILLSGISGLYGFVRPFKNNIKNYHEILFVVNLQVLCILTLSGLVAISVNVMIAMASLHFTFIFINNIITHMCGGVIRKKLYSCTKAIKECMEKKKK